MDSAFPCNLFVWISICTIGFGPQTNYIVHNIGLLFVNPNRLKAWIVSHALRLTWLLCTTLNSYYICVFLFCLLGVTSKAKQAQQQRHRRPKRRGSFISHLPLLSEHRSFYCAMQVILTLQVSPSEMLTVIF